MGGNPDLYPVHGTDAERRAWLKKDEELRGQVNAPPTAAAPKAKDPLELPAPLPPLGPYPWDGTDDDRLLWLQRCGVAYQREGITSYDRALHYEWLQITEPARQRDIEELMRENQELKHELNHLERQAIDTLAERIRQDTITFIEDEVTRQVSWLKREVAATSKENTSDFDAIERIQATTVLLRGRIAELEMLNPLWVKVHTKG